MRQAWGARSWLWHLAAFALVLGLGLLAARWVGAAAPGGPESPGGQPVPLAAVDFLDVPGHAVVVTADGHAVLVDGGDAAAGPPLVAFLRSQGIERLDAAFLSRPDDAFAGGLIDVLEGIPVKRLLDGGWASDCALYRSVLRVAAGRGVTVEPARAGSSLRLAAGVRLEVLSPGGSVGEEAPGPLVLRVAAGQVRFLLAAGAGPVEQERLLRLHGDLAAHVLDVPQRGAVLPGFLEAVRPYLAVGAGSPPDARLQLVGTTLLDPLRLGTVQFETDGRGVVIRFLPPAGGAVAPSLATGLAAAVSSPEAAAGPGAAAPFRTGRLGPMEAAVAASRAPVVSCG